MKSKLIIDLPRWVSHSSQACKQERIAGQVLHHVGLYSHAWVFLSQLGHRRELLRLPHARDLAVAHVCLIESNMERAVLFVEVSVVAGHDSPVVQNMQQDAT